MTQPKNILIVRTDRIGDVILTLPMAAVIKKHFPGCKVTFLVREYTKELALNNKFIDDVLILKVTAGRTNFYSNLELIKNRKFDTVITVYPRFILSLILFYSGIRTRVGTGYRWYSLLFNKRFYEHRKFGEKHELVHNINLLKTIGIDETVTEDICVFGLTPLGKNDIVINNYFANAGIKNSLKIVIFHPGSRGSAVDLPIEKMKEIINKADRELNINILITGDKKENAICDSFPKGERIYNLCGKFSLGELTALINKSDLLVANSTGPIHIAAALGKEVIGFFPKIKSQSPTRWAPFTKKKHIFVPSINCSNCTRKQCEELSCMNSISVDDVFETLKKIVNNSSRNN